jgi:uncharacterized protein YraI
MVTVQGFMQLCNFLSTSCADFSYLQRNLCRYKAVIAQTNNSRKEIHMFKSPIFIVTMIVMLLLASCAPTLVTPSPIVTEEPGIPITGAALVQSVEIQVVQSQPLQVNVVVRGELPDAGCTTISSVSQVRNGNTITVTLTTTTDPVALCAPVLTPFEQIVPLDVTDLGPDQYKVNVNGIEQSFEVPTRDASQFKQMLLEALNARDYERLKGWMDQSFLIAYWESEGMQNTPEAAVEQLQRNLLSSSTPVIADPNKNLAALLGTDPVTIVGPEVIEASPLFTTGWGPEGRDEAILFAAKQPNGDLYWHGLLFAKDGFAKAVPTVTAVIIPPVDTNAYPTDVKYVMALQDVRLRSGPGTQFSILSILAAGQTAKVTGISADGNWWRVVCPNDTVANCWVSARKDLTQPATPPHSNQPLPPGDPRPTNVQYVMAQQDVPIYGGPEVQYSIIGSLAAGQIARVTAVSADGKWWRVICPDNTVGNCWVSTDPALTTPTQSSGIADVQSVEIQILEPYPLQVNAITRGYLPDAGCTTISDVSQARNGNTFTITVKTKYDPRAFCAQALTPFEQVISLDVSSLLPANYIVIVNGVEAAFQSPEQVQPPNVQ